MVVVVSTPNGNHSPLPQNEDLDPVNGPITMASPTEEPLLDEDEEYYNGSMSKRKSLMNDKIAFSIRVQEQLRRMDFSMLNIPIWDHEEFDTGYLAEGFFGTTYKATHKPTKEVLVLKELKDYEDSESISQFLEEIRLCCRLLHPNVIKTKGITFNNEGRVCCLLEYIDGRSLLDLVDSLRLVHANMDVWLAYLDLTLDIARGMNYLHNNGVIHRDLNSNNVLCREIRKNRYEAIIIDFGLSYEKHDWSDLTEEGPSGCVGSVYHIAPELFDDQNCSTKSDVFSFGILICEMISGIPGADPDELPRTTDFGLDEKQLTELVHDCPAEFLNLAVRCCQTNPKHRPQFSDIIKLVDFIIDSLYDSDTNEPKENENESVTITTTVTSLKDDNNSNQVVNESNKETHDEYVLDSNLLCSCAGKNSKSLLQEDSTGEQFSLKTSYDRHGEIQRTSSRRVTRKFFKRCSFCAGRIFDTDKTLYTKPENQTSKDDVIDDTHRMTDDVIKPNNDSETADDFDTDRAKLQLNLDPTPALTVNSPSPPHLPPNLELPSPGIINSYTENLPSPNVNTFYQAGSILRQSKYEISTRTSQLVENTPSRLHTFFTHVLRRRKHHHHQNSDGRRGSKINLHKLFHFASSPKNTSFHPPTSSSTHDSAAHDSPAADSPAQTEHAPSKRRFTFGKTLKISRNEYLNRRKSMPIQMYRRRGSSTTGSPIKEPDAPHFPTLHTKSYSALSTIDRTESKNTFKNRKKTKSHTALNNLNQSQPSLTSKSQSDLSSKTKSQSSLNCFSQLESKNAIKSQSDLSNANLTPIGKNKKSRSFVDLFRKKVSH